MHASGYFQISAGLAALHACLLIISSALPLVSPVPLLAHQPVSSSCAHGVWLGHTTSGSPLILLESTCSMGSVVGDWDNTLLKVPHDSSVFYC